MTAPEQVPVHESLVEPGGGGAENVVEVRHRHAPVAPGQVGRGAAGRHGQGGVAGRGVVLQREGEGHGDFTHPDLRRTVSHPVHAGVNVLEVLFWEILGLFYRVLVWKILCLLYISFLKVNICT